MSFLPDPTLIHPDWPLVPPFVLSGHWLGTDDLGRDLLARLLVGARISLLIGLSTAAVSVPFGALYGIVAAVRGGWVDVALTRWVDVLYSLPGLMLVILASVFFGRSVPSLVLVLALFSWPDTARLVRGQMLALQQEDFMEAYRSLGGGFQRQLWRHILPNLVGFLLLSASITVPRAILTESTLSFIGLGVEPPLASWGTMAAEGWQLVRLAPHLLILPTVAIVGTMLALNLWADGLRRRLDPRSQPN